MEVANKLIDFLVNRKQFLLEKSHGNNKEFEISFKTPEGVSSQVAGDIINDYFNQGYSSTRDGGEIEVFEKESSKKILRVCYTAYTLPGFPGVSSSGQCRITIYDIN